MDEKSLAANFRFDRMKMYFHAKFVMEIILHPEIMIAGDKKQTDILFRQLRKF